MPKAYVLIPAGGVGSRMASAGRPKQFLPVAGKPILAHTMGAFDRHPGIDSLVVVCRPGDETEIESLARRFGIGKAICFAAGGDTRQLSVRNGLLAMGAFARENDIVLVHDGARPLVSPQIISQNIEGAARQGAVTTALPARDTILYGEDPQSISAVLDRRKLYTIQTPQSFRFGIISQAHRNAYESGEYDSTDDGSLFLRHGGGHPLGIVEGSPLNFKITVEEDLRLMEALLASRDCQTKA